MISSICAPFGAFIILTPPKIKTKWLAILIISVFWFVAWYTFAHGSQGYINDLDLSEPQIAYVTATRPLPSPAKAPIIAQVARKGGNQENIALGQQIALEQGIQGKEWACLYDLGMKESGWNHLARNKVSGAYGIAQSLPASKYDTFGDRNDPSVQIKWMLDYIENRYDTPCKALQFQVSHTPNWY